MFLFKLGFFIALAFLGGVAVFVGAVMMLVSLQTDAISIGYTVNGKPISETITRAADSARYWRLFVLMGALPFFGGGAALWWSVRRLRRG